MVCLIYKFVSVLFGYVLIDVVIVALRMKPLNNQVLPFLS